MKPILITALALLAGCATARLNEGLQWLVGQNIAYAKSYLGYPDGQREMMGDTIYVWSTSHSAILPYMNTSTTTGMVGNTPVYGSTSSMAFIPVQAQCTIQLAVGSDGIIKQYQWRGNQMGCREYASDFRGLALK